MMWNRKDKARQTVGVPVGLGVLVVAVMLLSSGWGCTPEIQQPPPRPDRGDSGESVGEMGDFRGFEEAQDYSRPDYAVRRNPFRPDPEAMGVDERDDAEEEIGPLSPTEEYALSSLELVTIMSETAVPKAMFVDPTGLGHFVKEGDRIGRRGGVIRGIRSNEVEIREGEGGGANTVTVRLRDHDPVRRAGDRLTEEEREALRRLLESEDGQEVLQRMETAGQQPQGTSPPSRQDDRFPGLRPPR